MRLFQLFPAGRGCRGGTAHGWTWQGEAEHQRREYRASMRQHWYIPVQRTRNEGIHELSRGSSAKLVNPGKTHHDIEMLHTFRLACAGDFITLDLTA